MENPNKFPIVYFFILILLISLFFLVLFYPDTRSRKNYKMISLDLSCYINGFYLDNNEIIKCKFINPELRCDNIDSTREFKVDISPCLKGSRGGWVLTNNSKKL